MKKTNVFMAFAIMLFSLFQYQNSFAQCATNQSSVTLTIDFSSDLFPDEDGWKLINTTTNTTVDSACFGAYTASTGLETIIFCLDTGDTYKLEAMDDFGDGLDGSVWSIGYSFGANIGTLGTNNFNIAFAHCGAAYAGNEIEDTISFTVTYVAPPACLPPSGLSADSLTSTTAFLNWIESGTATSWEVEWDTAGFISGNGANSTIVLTDTFLSVSGLLPATVYGWNVRAICGPGDTSGWVNSTFTTAFQAPQGFTCITGNSGIILSDDLESLNGWTGNIGTGTTLNNWNYRTGGTGSAGTGPNGAHSGSQYVYVETSGSGVGTLVPFISPAIDLSGGNDFAELSFWLHAIGGNIGTLNVGVGTSATGPFTNLFSSTGAIQTAQADPFVNVGINLDAYVGQIIYIQFEYVTNGSFAGDIALDLIEVSSCLSCTAPTTLAATNLTLSSADLSWIETGTATNWEIQYGLSGFPLGSGTSILTTTNPDTLTGLTASTAYDFYVRAICGPADSSGFTGPFTFNTLNGVPFVEDFEGFANGRANQNGWNNVNAADPDWTADNGGTGSTGTGPDVDHTLGTTLGRYIYLETSGGTLGARDTLSSPSILVGASQAFLSLDYWYHMAGATMGQMQVYVESAGIWDSITTYVGPQHAATSSPWLQGSHILTGYAGQSVTIHFIGEKGSSFTGDMAVDDVSLTEASPNNIGVTNILRPTSGCGLSSADTVEIVITNFGAAAQTSFDVGYSVNGIAITPETVTGTLGVGMSMNYTFATTANLSGAGNYIIDAYSLLTGDSDSTNDSSSTSVFNNPIISSFPYSESFESGPANWRTTGFTTFELGAPINTIIDTASDGTQAWVTDLDGPYLVNESGAVSSPCFDFTNISNPHISLDIWWDSENSWDGAVLQSSIDGGATWQKVGANGDPMNWFNDNTISGLASLEPSQEGWTGSPGSLGWVTATHALDGLGGLSSVQLRIAFGSDGSVVYEGFAFDNVNIYEVYIVPFAQDFESFNNGRSNQNDWNNRNASDPDWTIDNGGTGSTGTGPDVDHTLGTSIGKYVYLETSSGSQGDRDTLSSPSIIVDSTQTTLSLDYWYHMAGATMGEMQVWVESAGIWDSVATYVGPQQTATSDPWLLGSHILTGYAGQDVILHFIGEKGSSFTGDMAVDDVSLTEAPNDNIGITDIVRPVSGCGLSAGDSVEVTITNFGAASQTGFNVGYSLNGIAITPETVTGTLGVGMSMNYTFATTANLSAAGNYIIDAYTLLTGDADSTNDSSSTSVFNNAVVNTFPYNESFESGPASWRTTGFTTFELGAPINAIIDTASDGTQAWVTDLDGPYLVNESGAVNSPCFDFTNVSDPYIEMDIWWDAENSWDGAVLQSSIDGGATWQKVGADGDPFNWFNDNTIAGLASLEASQEGWTGSPGSLGWLTAEHALDGLGGQSSVQLRVAFGSDGSVVDEGFAFDNIKIYNNPPYYPISVINTVDTLGVADSLGLLMKTSGSVIGVDIRGGNGLQFTMVEQTMTGHEGIHVFSGGGTSGYTVNEGDSIEIIGTISQFNGLTQINPDSIRIIKTNAFIPAPISTSTLSESTESKWLSLSTDFVLLDPSGSTSYNMDATNGTDTITIRVDSDTDVNDSLNVGNNALVVGDTICGMLGIGGQFDNSSPYTSGYQIFPMRYSDITVCRLSVGIEDNKANEVSFNIAPNPTNGQFTITTSKLTSANAQLIVRDISGKVIFEERIISSGSSFTKTFDLSGNAKGIYFITIIDGNGRFNKKLIKQ